MAKQLNIRPEDADALGRIAYAEAGNQGPQGLAGVMYAVLNRLASNQWGSTLSDVLNSKNQFEPVGRSGGDWRNLPQLKPEQRDMAATLMQLIQSGQVQDPTGGATFFQNPTITQQRGTDFSAGNQGKRIGDHVFYDRYKGGAPVQVPDWTMALAQGMAGAQPPSSDFYSGQGAGQMQGGVGGDQLRPGQVPPSEYALSLPDLMAKLSGQGVQGFNFGGKAFAASPGGSEPYRVTYDRFGDGATPAASPGASGGNPGLIGGPMPSSLIGGPMGQAPITPTPNLPSAQTGLAAAMGNGGAQPVTSRIMDALFNAPPSNPMSTQAAPPPMQGGQPSGYDTLESRLPGLGPKPAPPMAQAMAPAATGPGQANIGQRLKDLASVLLADGPGFNNALMGPTQGDDQTGVSAGSQSLTDLAGRLFTDPSTLPQVNPPTGRRPKRPESPQDQVKGYTGLGQ